LQEIRSKVLVLGNLQSFHGPVVDAIRHQADVVEIANIDEAVNAFATSTSRRSIPTPATFLPLERALVSQQANLILDTIGEGVCIVDGEGRSNWMNRKMKAWPPRVHEKIAGRVRTRSTCSARKSRPPARLTREQHQPPSFNRSKRYALNIEEQQFLEMIAQPGDQSRAGRSFRSSPSSGTRPARGGLQQKIDAIDKAGASSCARSGRTEQDERRQRLKLLEEKIISFTSDLLHFDHFAIRLLDS
jgi:hypothetical protein